MDLFYAVRIDGEYVVISYESMHLDLAIPMECFDFVGPMSYSEVLEFVDAHQPASQDKESLYAYAIDGHKTRIARPERNMFIHNMVIENASVKDGLNWIFAQSEYKIGEAQDFWMNFTGWSLYMDYQKMYVPMYNFANPWMTAQDDNIEPIQDKDEWEWYYRYPAEFHYANCDEMIFLPERNLHQNRKPASRKYNPYSDCPKGNEWRLSNKLYA